MRRLLVALSLDSEATECGSCQYLANDVYEDAPECALFQRSLSYGDANDDPGSEHEAQRLPECLAAEQAATREELADG